MDEPTLYWCEEFLAADFPVETVIEDGILVMGEKMCVIGPSESGKSYLLLQLALELASGGAFFGRRIARPFRTLLLQSEVVEGEYHKRTRRWATAYDDLPPKMLALVTTESLKLNEPVGIQILGRILEEIRPDILVLDPLRAFVRGDENSSDVGEEFFTGLRFLQENTNDFTLIYAHHVRKPGSEWLDDGSKYDARGSGIWTDRPGTVLRLSANSGQTQWKLNYEKTRGRQTHPPSQTLYVDYETGLFEPIEEEGYGAGIAAIQDALQAGPVSLDSLVTDLKQTRAVSPRTVSRWLTEAEQAGVIERVRDDAHKSRKIIRPKRG